MPKKPTTSHEEIVRYILAGHSTRDAQRYFNFANANIANLKVHAAFKALSIKRPRYAENRVCEYCGASFVARDSKQRTCGSTECQQALTIDWQKKNPDAKRIALQKYRSTEKGKQNNRRMHHSRRERGISGSSNDRWNFAATEIKKSLRKLEHLATRGPWEYRLQHIQNMAKMRRTFKPRNIRSLKTLQIHDMWHEALRAIQTTTLQRTTNASSSIWEKSVNRIAGALRSGNKVREWKRKPYHLTTSEA